MQLLSQLDVQRATASLPTDRQQLLGDISRGSGGGGLAAVASVGIQDVLADGALAQVWGVWKCGRGASVERVREPVMVASVGLRTRSQTERWRRSGEVWGSGFTHGFPVSPCPSRPELARLLESAHSPIHPS
eukprot:339783-Chlamydomonas_euryale.AAC.1